MFEKLLNPRRGVARPVELVDVAVRILFAGILGIAAIGPFILPDDGAPGAESDSIAASSNGPDTADDSVSALLNRTATPEPTSDPSCRPDSSGPGPGCEDGSGKSGNGKSGRSGRG